LRKIEDFEEKFLEFCEFRGDFKEEELRKNFLGLVNYDSFGNFGNFFEKIRSLCGIRKIWEF
jgi:hypothetical protein